MTDPAVPKESPLYNSAADAACASAGFSARCTYAKGYEDGFRQAGVERERLDAYMLRLDAAESRIAVEASRADVAVRHLEACEDVVRAVKRERDAEKSRANVAEQRVCGMLDVLTKPGIDIAERVQTALSTADIAGRWVSVDEVRNLIEAHAREAAAIAERDAAIARADEMEAVAERWEDRYCHAIRARDEVGIQYAAAQERLRLAMACAEHLRDAIEDGDIVVRAPIDALRDLDTSNVKGG